MSVKLLVLYPHPQNPAEFERLYTEEHLPMGRRSLVGATRIETLKVLGAPSGESAIFQISEVTFPSLEALQACAALPDAQAVLAHAARISTGGAPQFVIAA